MISAIQTKLQKHNKVVFFALLALIIVAFVFTIGNVPGFGSEPQTARQDYFGYNLQSERDREEITKFGSLSYRMQMGQQVNPQRFNAYVLNRIAYLNLANDLGIPGPTQEQFEQFLTHRPAFLNAQGNFDANAYSSFVDNIEADPMVSQEDVGLVLEQDYRIEKARELLEGPGYVLPAEVRLQLKENQTLWSIELAEFDLSGFDPQIEVTDEEVQTFYEENSFRYERAPRVDFSYAVFSPESFLDEVEAPTEEELTAYFEQNKADFTPPEPAAPEESAGGAESEETAEQPEVTLADVRDEVEQAVRREKAQRLAGEAAADFAYAMFQQEVRPGDPAFDELLAQYQGEMRDAPAVGPENFPADLGFPPSAQQHVFRLSADRDFSDPVQVQENYVVLLHEETLPAFVPPLEEIRETVENDYRAQELRRLEFEKGEELQASLESRLAEGASFSEAAKAEGLAVTAPEPFDRTPPFPPEVPQQVLGRLDDLEQGEVSAMIPVQNTGYFIYLKNREVPEIDATSAEFAQVEERLQMFSAMGTQQSLLQEYIERESSLPAEE